MSTSGVNLSSNTFCNFLLFAMNHIICQLTLPLYPPQRKFVPALPSLELPSVKLPKTRLYFVIRKTCSNNYVGFINCILLQYNKSNRKSTRIHWIYLHHFRRVLGSAARAEDIQVLMGDYNLNHIPWGINTVISVIAPFQVLSLIIHKLKFCCLNNNYQDKFSKKNKPIPVWGGALNLLELQCLFQLYK